MIFKKISAQQQDNQGFLSFKDFNQRFSKIFVLNTKTIKEFWDFKVISP
jgi:hypothetical protein